MRTTWMHNFSLNAMQIFLYEFLTSTPKQIYLVQVQCKVQNAMHDDKQMFLDFLKIKEMQNEKNDSTTPRPCKHTQTTLKQSTKVKEL